MNAVDNNFKKYNRKHFYCVLCLTMLLSCSSGPNLDSGKASSNLEYASVPFIQGPLAEYVEVVKDLYPLEFMENENSHMGYDVTLKAKFRFLKPLDVSVAFESAVVTVYITILDEKGVPIDYQLLSASDRKLESNLKKGYGEEWLVFKLTNQNQDIEVLKKKLDKGRVLLFTSDDSMVGLNEDFSYSENGNMSSLTAVNAYASKSSTNECEEFIRDYEKFMDRYIKILKKYKNNPTDMSILTDYTVMLSEAQEWTTKSPECAGDIKFAAKIAKIQLKIANAATGL